MTSHFPLLSDTLMKSTPSHPTSLRSIPILSSALCLSLPNGLFPSDILAKTPHVFLFSWTFLCLNPARDKRFICSPKRPDWFWDSPSLSFSVYQACFQGVKWTEREVDHSSPSSAKVKNGWCNSSTSAVCLHGIDGENCTFPFTICFLLTGSLKTDHQKNIH